MRPVTSVAWLVLAIGMFCSVAPAHGDFARGYRAYERGDYATAFHQFAKAAKRGHATAQISLGWMYAQGLGVHRDDRKALYWYRRAADQGHQDAQAILSIRRLGDGAKGQEGAIARAPERHGQLTRDPINSQRREATHDATQTLEESQSAAYWHRKFAEMGGREAQLVLAVRYELGQGVAKNTRRAIYWYRTAAEQGSALAQFNLGLKYAIGEGVTLNPSRALYWYERAAARGHLESQFLAGVAYAQGHGVLPAPAQAVRWWQEAAERGYAPAQYQLGLMYAKGEGVAKNWSQAYLWVSLAAAQGHEDARRSRHELRRHIAPAEIARLENLARSRRFQGKRNAVNGNQSLAPTGAWLNRSSPIHS